MYNITSQVHADPVTGHRKGVRGTVKAAKEKFAGLIEKDFDFVKEDCTHCAVLLGHKLQKAAAKNKLAMVQRTKKKQDEVQVDLVDMRGMPSQSIGDIVYTWILVYVNTRTKYHKSVALMSKSALEVVSAVYRTWIGEGGSKLIRFDCGKEFVNELMTAMAVAFNVKANSNYSAGNPNATGIVERPNRVVKEMLLSFMLRMHTTRWHLLLPLVELGMANRWRRNLSTTPHQYKFGYSFPSMPFNQVALRRFIKLLEYGEINPSADLKKMPASFLVNPDEVSVIEKKIEKEEFEWVKLNAKETCTRKEALKADMSDKKQKLQVIVAELAQAASQLNTAAMAQARDALDTISTEMAELSAQLQHLESESKASPDELPLLARLRSTDPFEVRRPQGAQINNPTTNGSVDDESDAGSQGAAAIASSSTSESMVSTSAISTEDDVTKYPSHVDQSTNASISTLSRTDENIPPYKVGIPVVSNSTKRLQGDALLNSLRRVYAMRASQPNYWTNMGLISAFHDKNLTAKMNNSSSTSTINGEDEKHIHHLTRLGMIPPSGASKAWATDSCIANCLNALLRRYDQCNTDFIVAEPMTLDQFCAIKWKQNYLSKITTNKLKGINTLVTVPLNLSQQHWVLVTITSCDDHPDGCSSFCDSFASYGPTSRVYKTVKREMKNAGIQCRNTSTHVQGDGYTCAYQVVRRASLNIREAVLNDSARTKLCAHKPPVDSELKCLIDAQESVHSNNLKVVLEFREMLRDLCCADAIARKLARDLWRQLEGKDREARIQRLKKKRAAAVKERKKKELASSLGIKPDAMMMKRKATSTKVTTSKIQMKKTREINLCSDDEDEENEILAKIEEQDNQNDTNGFLELRSLPNFESLLEKVGEELLNELEPSAKHVNKTSQKKNGFVDEGSLVEQKDNESDSTTDGDETNDENNLKLASLEARNAFSTLLISYGINLEKERNSLVDALMYFYDTRTNDILRNMILAEKKKGKDRLGINFTLLRQCRTPSSRKNMPSDIQAMCVCFIKVMKQVHYAQCAVGGFKDKKRKQKQKHNVTFAAMLLETCKMWKEEVHASKRQQVGQKRHCTEHFAG